MRKIILLVLLAASAVRWSEQSGLAQGVEAKSEAPRAGEPEGASAQGATVDALVDKADFVAEGSRVTVKEGDFSLAPPRGWEVYAHNPSLTLLMQVPHQPGMKYQRTIQVASFSGPRYIDEVTAKEYEEVIVRKFSAATASVEGYRIRNHMSIEMADGRDGLLFYTEFMLDGVNLMQAHILVSSKDRHYLMTYTDVAEHFESDSANRFLTEAWDAMISVQLGSRTPSRFQAAIFLGIGIGGLLIASLVFLGLRRWRSGRQYRDYADGNGLNDVDLHTQAPRSAKTSIQRDESDEATAEGLPDDKFDSGDDVAI